jgi:flagellar biosynthetic protein FliO
MGLRGGRGRTSRLKPFLPVAAAVLVLLVGALWAGAQATWATTGPPPSLPSTGLQPGGEGVGATSRSPLLAAEGLSTMDYVSAALKFGLVLLLLYGALWALRRYARSGFVRGAPDSRRLALLETMPLAPRQALHLVRADDRTLLLGASEHGITLLAEWTADSEGDRPVALTPSSPAEVGAHGRAPLQPPPPLRGRVGLGGDTTPSVIQGEGIARLASAFAQHLRQAIQRREHHAA